MSSPVSFTPVSSMQPPVVQQGNNVQLNMTLTIPESMFVVFAKSILRQHLDQGSKLMYLGVSQDAQDGFNRFVATKFPSANLSPEQLKLSSLVGSLWEKTKTTVDNELRIKANQNDIRYENQLHQQAVAELETLRAQGRTGGKIFTEKQAQLIIKI